MIQLPDTYKEQMQLLLGEEYDDYIRSFEDQRVYGLRVNTTKITPQEFEEISPFPLKRIPWVSNGYYYPAECKPAKHPYYYAGLYYLQEPSAMTPASKLSVEPGDRVLDLCAAPGGKSTELAANLWGQGVLVSNDISNSRAKALLKNLELFGIPNSIIMSEIPSRLESHYPEYFDKILIDAPCSGEGMFRKEPSVIKSWLEKGNEYFATIQRSILDSAYRMLKPGGKLLYSTCTFSPVEDEESILYMLREHPDMHVAHMTKIDGFEGALPIYEMKYPELQNCIRIWPHKVAGEGHFVCLMEKDGEPVPNMPTPTGRPCELPKELEEFLKQIKGQFDRSRIEIRQEKVYYLPEMADNLAGLRILRSGLLLGELKKNRFEPSQALAMCLRKKEFDQVIDMPCSDDRVIRYLKGETLDISDFGAKKGWQLVCVDGYPLGFGKAAGGQLKNKYLAGWRWQ